MKQKKLVCLGGGIGTVNLIKGLKEYSNNITVVVSMADEGGSAGRLRRLYNIMPPGDVVSCMAALSNTSQNIAQLLTYRFPGDRYGKDHSLPGHKLGNLMMVAARDITGDFESALKLLSEIFQIKGNILPATKEHVSISARTVENVEVRGEEKIDLGQYEGKRVLDHVYLHPAHASIPQEVRQALQTADVIIAGPGDLYTTVLPVLIIPEVTEILQKSKAKKVFVVNVANKPFETKGYDASDFIDAIKKHIPGRFFFDTVIVNNNFTIEIPKEFKYTFVPIGKEAGNDGYSLVTADLVDSKFPIYHDHAKLAKVVFNNI